MPTAKGFVGTYRWQGEGFRIEKEGALLALAFHRKRHDPQMTQRNDSTIRFHMAAHVRGTTRAAASFQQVDPGKASQRAINERGAGPPDQADSAILGIDAALVRS